MKATLQMLFLLATTLSRSFAGESMLTQTFQPLDGLGSGEIQIAPVMCHDLYRLSGFPTAIGLITVPNIPPTNSSQPVDDINVASASGIKVSWEESGPKQGSVIIDCTHLHPDTAIPGTEQQVVRATLECLRLVAGQGLDQMLIKATLKSSGQEEIAKIVEEFVKHPKDVEFPWK